LGALVLATVRALQHTLSGFGCSGKGERHAETAHRSRGLPTEGTSRHSLADREQGSLRSLWGSGMLFPQGGSRTCPPRECCPAAADSMALPALYRRAARAVFAGPASR